MVDVFRNRIETAFSDGFSLLRRLPSTAVWKSLSYIESLSQAERVSAFDTCARIAQRSFAGERAAIGTADDVADRSELHAGIFSELRWSEFPDRFMKQFDGIGLDGMVEQSQIPAIVACDPPVVAKAPAIRKVLHPHLKDSFNAEISNRGGGNWAYMGLVSDRQFTLNIDYGGMGSGFRYSVGFGSSTRTPNVLHGVSLESSYGLPTSVCDFPLADELHELASTVTDLVVDLANLQTQIDERDIGDGRPWFGLD